MVFVFGLSQLNPLDYFSVWLELARGCTVRIMGHPSLSLWGSNIDENVSTRRLNIYSSALVNTLGLFCPCVRFDIHSVTSLGIYPLRIDDGSIALIRVAV